MIDFGCGDGNVASQIQKDLGVKVTGYDVRRYVPDGLDVAFEKFDGTNIYVKDGCFMSGIMIGVTRSESETAVILRELSRVIKDGGRLVVIDTIPESKQEVSHELCFINDYVQNRLLYNVDLPAPGFYQSGREWLNQAKKVNFKMLSSVPGRHFLPTSSNKYAIFVFKRVP